MRGAGWCVHGDELLEAFLIFAWVRFLIERQSDKDAFRNKIRSSKKRFMMVIRGGFCIG